MAEKISRKEEEELQPIKLFLPEVGLPGRLNAQKHTDDTGSILEQPEQKKRKLGSFAVASDLLFYTVVLMILLAAVTSGTNSGRPRTIFGYSYFTVVSRSMQSEIPEGSFILVKYTDPQHLAKGDNITYMRDSTTSVTHQIMGVYENYADGQGRGFRTGGVDNADFDNAIVKEADVIGKVVLVIPTVGALIAALGENLHLVFIIFGLCVIISFCLWWLFEKPVRKTVSKDRLGIS